MADLRITEGKSLSRAPGVEKTCKTWYKTVGNLSPEGAKSAKTPLVVEHGGPGAGHDYLLALTDLVANYSTPVIFYDQIGCGRSAHLPEKKGDEPFWLDPLFIRELDNLIDYVSTISYTRAYPNKVHRDSGCDEDWKEREGGVETSGESDCNKVLGKYDPKVVLEVLGNVSSFGNNA